MITENQKYFFMKKGLYVENHKEYINDNLFEETVLDWKDLVTYINKSYNGKENRKFLW